MHVGQNGFHNVPFFPRKKVTKEISRNRNARIQSQPHLPSISMQETYLNILTLCMCIEIEILRLNLTPARTRRFRYILTNADIIRSESVAMGEGGDACVQENGWLVWWHERAVFFGMSGWKHRAGSDSEKVSLLLSLAPEKEERSIKERPAKLRHYRRQQ